MKFLQIIATAATLSQTTAVSVSSIYGGPPNRMFANDDERQITRGILPYAGDDRNVF